MGVGCMGGEGEWGAKGGFFHKPVARNFYWGVLLDKMWTFKIMAF